VKVKHNSDFAGYSTAYCHLSSTAVKLGAKVTAGTVIGAVGLTGGYGGKQVAGHEHLHFVIGYSNGAMTALVNPTYLVPNWWPGHEDSTSATKESTLLANFIPSGALGATIIYANAVNTLATTDRATDLQNVDRVKMVDLQNKHYDRIQDKLTQAQQQVAKAGVQFSLEGFVVTNPMTFDFKTGVWSDNQLPT
jgi:murein DD-endopeptidase MepM/ murein hydrolase activator NlpD